MKDKQKDFAVPCSTSQDPPLNGTVQKRCLDLAARHTNVWRNSLRVDEQ